MSNPENYDEYYLKDEFIFQHILQINRKRSDANP